MSVLRHYPTFHSDGDKDYESPSCWLNSICISSEYDSGDDGPSLAGIYFHNPHARMALELEQPILQNKQP